MPRSVESSSVFCNLPSVAATLRQAETARMPLNLRYTETASVPVEFEGITPDRVHDKSLAEIERMEILHGNRKVPLAELFAVSGDLVNGRSTSKAT